MSFLPFQTEASEPHRTARTAEQLQQDRLQNPRRRPWKSRKSKIKKLTLISIFLGFRSDSFQICQTVSWKKKRVKVERSTFPFSFLIPQVRLLHCMSCTENIPTLPLLPVAIDGIRHLSGETFFCQTVVSMGLLKGEEVFYKAGPHHPGL